MSKAFKIFSYTFFTIFFMVVIGFILLMTLLDPNQYKSQLSDYASEKTGREVQINGKLSWTLFPWLGLKVNDITVASPKDFADQSFLKVGSAEISVKLLPLLKGEIQVGKLYLNHLDANLVKNNKAQSNWQFMAAPQPEQKTESDSRSTFDFTITSLRIANSTLKYTDQSSNQSYEVIDLSFESDNLQLEKNFPVKLAFQYGDNNQFSLHGNLLIDTDNERYTISKMTLINEFASNNPNVSEIEIIAKASIAYNGKTDTLTSQDLTLSLVNMNMTANLTVDQLTNKPIFQGEIDTSPFNLKTTLKQLGYNVQTQNPNALQNAEIDFDFTATTNSLAISNINLALDQTAVDGNITIDSFKPSAMRFNLKANQLNMDHYLPPETAKTSNEQPLNLSPLKQAKINGNIRIDSLTVSSLISQNVIATLSVDNGIVKISPVKAQFYQGNVDAKVTMDINNKQPKYTVYESISEMNINSFMQAFGNKSNVTGTANIKSNIAMSGNNSKQLKSTMNGDASINIKSGRLSGVDLTYMIQNAFSKAAKKEAEGAKDNNQTGFSSLTATAKIANGIISTDDLQLTSSVLSVKGEGTINLVNEKLNLHLEAKSKIPLSFVGDAIIPGSTDLDVPILVTGTISKPRYIPDISRFAQTFIKNKTEALIKTPVESVMKIIPGAKENNDETQNNEPKKTKKQRKNKKRRKAQEDKAL